MKRERDTTAGISTIDEHASGLYNVSAIRPLQTINGLNNCHLHNSKI